MFEAAPGWYSQVCVGQAYLEKDLSLGDREEKVVVVLSPAQGRFVRPAWKILVRDMSGRTWIKDIHFFGGNPRRIF